MAFDASKHPRGNAGRFRAVLRDETGGEPSPDAMNDVESVLSNCGPVPDGDYVQSVEVVAPGVVQVDTGGHVWTGLSAEVEETIPECLRSEDGWYNEAEDTRGLYVARPDLAPEHWKEQNRTLLHGATLGVQRREIRDMRGREPHKYDELMKTHHMGSVNGRTPDPAPDGWRVMSADDDPNNTYYLVRTDYSERSNLLPRGGDGVDVLDVSQARKTAHEAAGYPVDTYRIPRPKVGDLGIGGKARENRMVARELDSKVCAADGSTVTMERLLADTEAKCSFIMNGEATYGVVVDGQKGTMATVSKTLYDVMQNVPDVSTDLDRASLELQHAGAVERCRLSEYNRSRSTNALNKYRDSQRRVSDAQAAYNAEAAKRETQVREAREREVALLREVYERMTESATG